MLLYLKLLIPALQNNVSAARDRTPQSKRQKAQKAPGPRGVGLRILGLGFKVSGLRCSRFKGHDSILLDMNLYTLKGYFGVLGHLLLDSLWTLNLDLNPNSTKTSNLTVTRLRSHFLTRRRGLEHTGPKKQQTQSHHSRPQTSPPRSSVGMA